VFVACSTLCFGRHSLEEAIRLIGELKFAKIDLAVHEEIDHLKPTEVAADVPRISHRLKSLCPLGLSAFHVQISAPDPVEYDRQLRAVCRLARLTTVPVVCIPAPKTGSELSRVEERLAAQVKIASNEGVILTAETLIGTVTEIPEAAVELCDHVRGLGLTLDPSHYLVGPARGQSFDCVFPYVKHVRLRDTGAGPHDFQVRLGQGHVDYGKIIATLAKHHYDRLLTVDIRDIPDAPFAIDAEVRKLKYLLESLV
jgi:sugar phosphate isomerase/epimerase